MRGAAAIVCVAAAIAAAALSAEGVLEQREAVDAAIEMRRSRLSGMVAELDEEARELRGTAESLASACAAWAGAPEERTQAALENIVRSHVAEGSRVSGIGVAFVPDAVVEGTLGLNLLVDTDDMRRVDGDADYCYDYSVETEERGAWYRLALEHPDGHWHDPTYGGSSERMLIEHTLGVRLDGRLIGVVFVNWTYDDVRETLLAHEVEGTTEALVVTETSHIVFSGHESWFEHGADIGVVAEKLDLPKDIGARALEPGPGQLLDLGSRRGAIDVMWDEVPTHGWRVILVFYENAATVASRQRTDGPLISIFVVLALIAAAIAIHHGRGRSDWDVAIAMTVVFGAATVYLWWLAHEHGGMSRPTDQERLLDHFDVQSAVRSHLRQMSDADGDQSHYFVPTGVFIQSAHFLSAHDVAVTGYVWQRAPAALVAPPDQTDGSRADEEKLTLGVVMPEAESAKFERVYTKRQGDEIVVGWYFTASLRQPFDYDDYPFETEEIWIRLWPRQFHRNVVLLPDLESYDPRPASAGRGVEETMFLPGWDIRSAYFSHRPRSYNTNFGLNDYQGQLNFPELYFNVEIRREVTSPFITHIVPLGLVLMTLFILLSVTSKESIPEIGFTSIAVIGTIVGIFFVVILQHISLRRSLQASGFVYLEVFYFLTYLYLLLVVVNSVVTVVDLESEGPRPEACARTWIGWISFAPLALAKWLLVTGARFLNRGGNRTVRYVYWPLYFGLIWVCTLTLTFIATRPG